jgi:hypothetical protein
MSGGYIDPQGDGEHQFVTFTFAGRVTQAQADAWNNEIARLKQMFGARLVGVTVTGKPTPPQFMRRRRAPTGRP